MIKIPMIKMLIDVLTWMVVNPWWPFLIFPLVFGFAVFMTWHDICRKKNLEADPIRMTNAEYHDFNYKRFQK